MNALDPSILSVRDFSAGFAAFLTNDHFGGYIDHTGTIRIRAVLMGTRPFCSDGTAPVRTDAGWGLIDVRGQFVMQPAHVR
jgi:hypothetical protein